MAYDDERGGRGLLDYGNASVGGFLVTLAIFMCILTLGYFNYARLMWPSAPLLVQGLLGFFVAFAALLLARATAAMRANRHERPAGSRHAWILYFVLLLSISALGTMNAMFYVFEGDQVADQRVEQARKDLALLKSAGKQALAVPEFEALQGDVRSLLGELSQRVFSVGGGNSCGVGADAIATISRIAGKLPGYAVIPYTTLEHDCRQREKLQSIYEQYVQQADRLLHATPLYREKGMARRLEAATTLEASVDDAMSQLSVALTDSGGSARGVARNYGSLQMALKNAADAYQQQSAAVESITGTQLALPESLEIQDVEQLGNIAYVITSILGRLNRIQTYFYILAAVALDAFMVWAFTAVMGDLASGAAGPARRPANRQDAEVRVKYLWTDGRS